jgi:hypothetical protein
LKTFLPKSADRMPDLSQKEKDRIVYLWAERKRGLSLDERKELHALIYRKLLRTRLPDQFNDPEARSDLINDYIINRVILNAETTKAGPLRSADVLHKYLKRYALDEIENIQTRQKPVHDKTEFAALQQETEEHVETSITSCLEASPPTEQADTDNDADDEVSKAENATTHLSTSQYHLLAEAGIDLGNAVESARRFVAMLEAAEKAYLALNTCSDEENRQPISAIADRLRLGSSYHYKAKQLGITGSKGGFYQGYEKTRIGQWLVSLGAQINREWQRELMVLLVILCSQVLGQTKGEEA